MIIKMKKLTQSNKNYLWSFVETEKTKVEQPEGITVEYDTIGYYGGKHALKASIETSKGLVEIRFYQDDMWGYINGLGVCYLNDVLTNTSELIGKYNYTRNESNLCNIIEKLWNI